MMQKKDGVIANKMLSENIEITKKDIVIVINNTTTASTGTPNRSGSREKPLKDEFLLLSITPPDFLCASTNSEQVIS